MPNLIWLGLVALLPIFFAFGFVVGQQYPKAPRRRLLVPPKLRHGVLSPYPRLRVPYAGGV